MKKGFVYLIEAENGIVKLGFTRNPTFRIIFFQLHSPVFVRTIALWPGEQKDEFTFHREFAEYRSHSEWFFCRGRFADFVESRRGQGVEAIQSWDDLRASGGRVRRRNTSEERSRAMKEAWAEAKQNPKHCGLAWRAARKLHLAKAEAVGDAAA